VIDAFTPEALIDPHPVFKRLREQAPVHFHESLDMWTIARHADVLSVLRDARMFSSELGIGELMEGRLVPGQAPTERMPNYEGPMRLVIAADPPDHTRLRRLVSAPFGPREMAPLEGRLQELCDGFLDDLLKADEPDLIGHVGWPLPVTVIAEVLGIPADRRADFRRWSMDMVGALSGQVDIMTRAQSAMEMFEFFSQAIVARQSEPGDDTISFLVAKADVLEGEDRLSVEELVAFCILLLIAGNETTTNLVGNAAHAFFEHPDQWQRLVDDPSLVGGAVEEMLRFDGPVKGILRVPREDVEVAGVAIPAGARVMPLFASANRDESVFPNADALIVDRHPEQHVAFGYGIHHCLGAPLARMEARVLFESLAKRGVTLEPRGDSLPVSSPILRGFTSVPVAIA
jgi:cytochrome P450